MAPYTIRALDARTWDAFSELVERSNGIFGSYRAVKEDRVRTGRAHAALVLDEGGAAPSRPDRRITCFYVDKRHRGQGAISEATTGRKAPGRFLFSATVELFEHHGFTRGRQVGKYAWIVSTP